MDFYSFTLNTLILLLVSLYFANCNEDDTIIPSPMMPMPTQSLDPISTENVLAWVFIFKLIYGDMSSVSINIESNGTSILKDFTLESSNSEILSITNSKIYTGTFVWKQLTAKIPVYEPSRDAGKEYVYLKISEDGLYLGYDKSSINKIVPWTPKGF